MRKRCGDNKNRVYKKARVKKLKGQCNEKFLLGHCLTGRYVTRIRSIMRKRCGDNQNRTYKKAMAKKLKGQCNENLLLGNCSNGGSITRIRITVFLNNGTRQFQIIVKKTLLSKVPVVGIQTVCGEKLLQELKKGEKLKCTMEGNTMHDDD
jgi:hypothetical protein